jgi:hypothetical protein
LIRKLIDYNINIMKDEKPTKHVLAREFKKEFDDMIEEI